MPDNWGFVFAAYGLTAVVLALYWRHLVRKEKDLQRQVPRGGSTPTTTAAETGSARLVAGSPTAHTEREQKSSRSERQSAERSHEPSRTGHPRPDPTTRGPLQQ